MNHELIIKQYSNGRTLKWLAIEHDACIDVIRNIIRCSRDEEKTYMKEMQEIARKLPRHDDSKADAKWEAALGQGAFN